MGSQAGDFHVIKYYTHYSLVLNQASVGSKKSTFDLELDCTEFIKARNTKYNEINTGVLG